MRHPIRSLYVFGDFCLDVGERLLLRDNKPIALTSKVFDILTTLVQNSGHLLEKDDLMQAIWPDTAVEEGNLTRYVSTLRKALGEQSNGCQYIETVPKRGYRFVADVKVVQAEKEQLRLREPARAQVNFESEEETDGQNEMRTELVAPANVQAKASRAVRWGRQALIAGVTVFVVMAAAAYWWKTIKARQAETNAQIKSIAVLPFTQLGEGEKDELLGFGMADVLITRIGSLSRIAVRPTSAVFKYVGPQVDTLSAGMALKVDAILEGNIQRRGDQIRVTVRLVRARDGELLWADTFDGRSKEPFQLQDRMSERVAAALLLNPQDERNTLLTKRYTDKPEAYQAYMKGRYFLTKRTTDGLKKSIDYFERAVDIDPSYALAFAGLADGYSLLVNYTQISPKEGFPKAKEAATKALRIDDTLAEAHASLAKIHHLYDWDWEAAEREFKRAIELNPVYATAHQWYGEYLISMGRFAEAKAEMKRALEFDPVSIAINVAQGFPYYFNREYDEAIAAYKNALELDPNLEHAHLRLHDVYVQKRMYDEAIAEYVASYNSIPKAQESLKTVYAASGMRGIWESSVATSQEQLDRCCSRYIAGIYAHLGDREHALKWLEKAYQERSHMMVDLKVEPVWDGLRSDPRFTDLLRRLRLSE